MSRHGLHKQKGEVQSQRSKDPIELQLMLSGQSGLIFVASYKCHVMLGNIMRLPKWSLTRAAERLLEWRNGDWSGRQLPSHSRHHGLDLVQLATLLSIHRQLPRAAKPARDKESILAAICVHGISRNQNSHTAHISTCAIFLL